MALQTPSPTLYVTNIESKIKKPALYALFNPYGQIIDIVAKKHGGGRGQAFVVFAEQTAATSALRGLSGEAFYGKNLDIVYAKTTSNATLSRQDPSKSREAAAIQAARLVVSRAQGEYEQLEKERQEQEAGLGKRVLDDEARAEGDGPSKKPKRDEEEEEEEMEMEMEDDDDAAPSDGSVWLICTNLPPECNEDIMGALYSQHAGFKSASANTSPAPSTHPAPNANAKSFRIAFTSKQQADAAAQATKGFLMQPGWAMGVSVQA